MPSYSPAEIEARWQAAWEKNDVFQAVRNADKPKYYVLEMFPYPSGRIHMGHVRNYTMGDVIARYKIATGHNVLHPMGWDAFGMPAENAAMAIGGHPKDWTYGNIADMRDQMKPLGLSIDWSREFATCDPEYYGQQQALFLDFLSEGLVYRKNAIVNWDPVDMTVLANEQVEAGRGWRSGALVERRELTQWFFKISDHSEELLDALDTLDNWPAKVKLMQANWIGKSRGLQFAFSTIDAPEGFRPDRSLHHTPRHPAWRKLCRHFTRSPAGQTARERQPRGCGLLCRMSQGRHNRRSDRDCRKAGDGYRPACAPPLRYRVGTAHLYRELHPDGLRHRGDLWLPRP